MLKRQSHDLQLEQARYGLKGLIRFDVVAGLDLLIFQMAGLVVNVVLLVADEEV